MEFAVLTYPSPSLVVLVGMPASGKTTYAARHFEPTEVVSLDYCRGAVSDWDSAGEADAQELYWAWIQARLKLRRRTVADNTNLTPPSRSRLLRMARRQDVPCQAVVLVTPLDLAIYRNAQRLYPIDAEVMERCNAKAAAAKRDVLDEGFDSVTFVTALDPRTLEPLA